MDLGLLFFWSHCLALSLATWLALCAMISVTPLVSAICCGRCHFWWPLWCSQSNPCHVPGPFGAAALPTWGSPRHQGVSVLPHPGAAVPSVPWPWR